MTAERAIVESEHPIVKPERLIVEPERAIVVSERAVVELGRAIVKPYQPIEAETILCLFYLICQTPPEVRKYLKDTAYFKK